VVKATDDRTDLTCQGAGPVKVRRSQSLGLSGWTISWTPTCENNCENISAGRR
jgi:hypothetical protein